MNTFSYNNNLIKIKLEGPPGFVVVGTVFGGMGRGITVVGGARVGFIEEMTPLLAMGDHAVDGAPVGESAYIAVVDEEVGLQLAGEVGIVVGGLLGVVAIGGVELDAALTTPLEGLVKKLALATGPEDQAMAILDEHLQGVDGEGAFLANLGVFIFDDGPVEINSYCHNYTLVTFVNHFLTELSFSLW